MLFRSLRCGFLCTFFAAGNQRALNHVCDTRLDRRRQAAQNLHGRKHFKRTGDCSQRSSCRALFRSSAFLFSADTRFTGTSAQRDNNFNAPSAVCRAAVLYVFRIMVDSDIPMNAGCLRPINIVIPDNSMLRPHYPAAVVAVHGVFPSSLHRGERRRPPVASRTGTAARRPSRCRRR